MTTSGHDRREPAGREPFSVGGAVVDPASGRITRDGEAHRVEPKAMAVLVILAERAGTTVSRRALEDAVWSGRIVTEDAVTNTIIKLRRALGDDARAPRIIETIPKTGYRLVAPVSFDPVGDGEAAGPPVVARRRGVLVVAAAVALAAGIALAALLLGDAAERGGGAVPGAEGRPVVAVLPFRSLHAPDGRDYFADGLAADLITDLAKLSGLRVIAPQSAFSVGGDPASNLEAAAALDVDYIVRGSVQKSGERLRINARLVDTADDSTLWAQRYDRGVEDIFRIQDEVARGIVAALRVRVPPGERARLARRSTASVAAYEAFLRGQDLYGRRTPPDNREALRHYEEAVRLDPGFGRAYAGLALAHARRAMDGWSESPERDLERALEYARQAAAIDPALPPIHFVRGQVELFRGRHREALAAVDRALDLAPSYADALALKAWIMSYAGRTDEALAALGQAEARNPRVPASYREIRGEIEFIRGRYRESMDALRQALAQNPAHLRARVWLAAAAARAGDREEAAWQVAEIRTLDPGFSLAHMSLAFPFKDPRSLEDLLFGLRAAGLPE